MKSDLVPTKLISWVVVPRKLLFQLPKNATFPNFVTIILRVRYTYATNQGENNYNIVGSISIALPNSNINFYHRIIFFSRRSRSAILTLTHPVYVIRFFKRHRRRLKNYDKNLLLFHIDILCIFSGNNFLQATFKFVNY